MLPGAAILLYHRVAELPDDPQLLSVSPHNFEEHLQFLRAHFSIVSLVDLAAILHEGKSTKGIAVITFDDGYADNFENAKPLLEKYRVPATCFVTAGYVGGQHEFWWDYLERIFLQPGDLPKHLSIKANGISYFREIQSAQYNEDDYRQYLSWNVCARTFPTDRQVIYHELQQLMRPLKVSDRNAILEFLSEWSGVDLVARTRYRVVSTAALKNAGNSSLLEIGAHTIDHPVLSAISPENQWNEILRSKTVLEDMIGGHVRTFSYPFGAKADYTKETLELVKRAGFVASCSNFPARVHRGTDPFQLPRYLVRDCSKSEFEKEARERGLV